MSDPLSASAKIASATPRLRWSIAALEVPPLKEAIASIDALTLEAFPGHVTNIDQVNNSTHRYLCTVRRTPSRLTDMSDTRARPAIAKQLHRYCDTLSITWHYCYALSLARAGARRR